MRPFRNPLLNWMTEHPVLAFWALVGVAILLVIVMPYVLPIRKVPLRYNLRNLQNRWMTTLVTALAFTLVTALLTGMLAFVKGMDQLIESSGHPGNVMVLSDGSTDETFSNLPPFVAQMLPADLQKEIVTVETEPGNPKSRTFLVSQEVYVLAMYMIPNAPPGGRQRRFMQLRGMSDMQIAAHIHDVQLAKGNWPSAAGVRKLPSGESALEIVIGAGVARMLGPDFDKDAVEVDDTVVLGKRTWVVTGIMEAGTSSFGSEMWTRDRHVQENFGRENSYCSYIVRTDSAEKAALARDFIKDKIKLDRNLQAYTEREYYAKMTDTSKQFSAAIYVVAIIMAIGGMLGIMNTMYAAISQRSKDIGVLRLMGYRRWQILLSFQFEALLIAVLGGILGCAIAYFAFHGQSVTSLITSGPGGPGKTIILRITFDYGVLAAGAIFSLIMGGVGGFLPSYGAMRLRPLESLK